MRRKVRAEEGFQVEAAKENRAAAKNPISPGQPGGTPNDKTSTHLWPSPPSSQAIANTANLLHLEPERGGVILGQEPSSHWWPVGVGHTLAMAPSRSF